VNVRAEITRRQGCEADREFLYDLLKRALGPHIEATYGPWDDNWQRRHFLETTTPSAHEIVESQGCPIGCLLIEEHPEALELHRILIVPENQNRGIGSSLMRQILSAAIRKNECVRLQVFRANHPGIRFYQRLGFQSVGETETHVIMKHAV
jgi:ribosomal protein S18 acetylase RimI-like enzyme